MRLLDAGCGTAKVEGAIGIDRFGLSGVDVVYDLNKVPWPFKDKSFDEIYLSDIIEHLTDTIKIMEECYRLLKNGGKLHIRVVYWNHRYAFSDPTHVNFFSEISFDFFSGKRRNYYSKAKFEIDTFEYIYDTIAKRVFFSKKIMNLLSYFLCNIKQGMKVTLTKKSE